MLDDNQATIDICAEVIKAVAKGGATALLPHKLGEHLLYSLLKCTAQYNDWDGRFGDPNEPELDDVYCPLLLVATIIAGALKARVKNVIADATDANIRDLLDTLDDYTNNPDNEYLFYIIDSYDLGLALELLKRHGHIPKYELYTLTDLKEGIDIYRVSAEYKDGVDEANDAGCPLPEDISSVVEGYEGDEDTRWSTGDMSDPIQASALALGMLFIAAEGKEGLLPANLPTGVLIEFKSCADIIIREVNTEDDDDELDSYGAQTGAVFILNVIASIFLGLFDDIIKSIKAGNVGEEDIRAALKAILETSPEDDLISKQTFPVINKLILYINLELMDRGGMITGHDLPTCESIITTNNGLYVRTEPGDMTMPPMVKMEKHRMIMAAKALWEFNNNKKDPIVH